MRTKRAAGCFVLAAVLFLPMLSTTTRAGDTVTGQAVDVSSKEDEKKQEIDKTCAHCHTESVSPFTKEPNLRFKVHIGAELIGLCISVIAAILVIVSVIWSLWQRVRRQMDESDIRIRFGERVSAALGLLIAAEILSSVGAPTLNKLYAIGLTVIIRALVGAVVAWEEYRAQQRTRGRLYPYFAEDDR